MRQSTQRRGPAIILGLLLASGCGQGQGQDHSLESLEPIDPTMPAGGEFRTERLHIPGLGVRDITYQWVDGQAIFEGDIILDLDRLRVADGTDASRSAGRRDEATRWVGGVVPFIIDPSLPANDSRISGAIAHWQANTPIQFVARTNEPDFVRFKNGSVCATTNIGRLAGEVDIFLSSTGCSTGNAIHEIGHAVGLFHEQSRADRDAWIQVNWNNIQSGFSGNFNTYLELGSDGVDSSTFDFNSVMLYSSNAFSSNGLPTMVRRSDGSTWTAQRNGLSFPDIQGVGRMYPRFPNFVTADFMPSIQSNLGPTITSWGRDRLDVLAIALDGTLRHQFSNDGGSTWSGWIDNFGGNLISGVDAVSWGPNRLDAVAKGTNNSIFHFWFDSGQFGWEDLGQQMKFDPGVSTWSTGNLDVFCIGTNNALKHRAFRQGSGWFGWEDQGGILTAGVDAVSWGVNRIDMVSRNSNAKLVHKTFDGSWSQWTDRGGTLSTSTPTIASRSPGHFDIFATFTNGNIWKRSYELNWEINFGQVGGALTEPDVVSDAPGRFDMVGLVNGSVHHGSIRNN